METQSIRFGWVGLGAMGAAHVDNLITRASISKPMVWNRDAHKCESAVAKGAVALACAKDVVANSDVTFVMLSSPDVALQVYTAPDGILAGLSSGKSVVECASLDSTTMRDLERMVVSCGARFMSALVVGHSGMAKAATVQFLCAGDESLFAEVGATLDGIGKNKVWFGNDVGVATNAKLVINALLANITASMAEALCVAKEAGISERSLLDVIGGHAMNSPLLQLCGDKMTHSGHAPALFMMKHMAKDVRLACELAETLGQANCMGPAARALYESSEKAGVDELNWTAVHEILKQRSAKSAAAQEAEVDP